MNIEEKPFNKQNNEELEPQKIEVVPGSEKAGSGQSEFYKEQIVEIKNMIDARKRKGENTKDLEERLKQFETSKEEAEKKL